MLGAKTWSWRPGRPSCRVPPQPMGGGALPAPPGCAPPDWLLVVAAARSAFTGAWSESVELERPRRPRTAVQLPPPPACSLEPRSDAGRTQTGWKELGPRGVGAGAVSRGPGLPGKTCFCLGEPQALSSYCLLSSRLC